MALIEGEIRKLIKERNLVHKPVNATFSIFVDEIYNKKYFQIDTYGSSDRIIKGKISQSLQLDRETAIRIVEILRKEYDI